MQLAVVEELDHPALVCGFELAFEVDGA